MPGWSRMATSSPLSLESVTASASSCACGTNMTPETHAVIEHEIELAVSSGYRMNRYFCLVGDKKGCYAAPDKDCPSCHPLETIVIGQPILDAINLDIAFNL